MGWLSQIFGFLKSFQFWFVVAPWESALRVRFGKQAKSLGPGPHWRVPFIDRVFVQPVRLRTISDTGQTVTTKDGDVLTLSLAIAYAVEDIAKLYNSVNNPECTLLTQMQGLVAEVISTTDRRDLSPALIERTVAQKLPSTEWGLGQLRLMVTTFAFVRVYRLMQSEYRTLSGSYGSDNLDAAQPT